VWLDYSALPDGLAGPCYVNSYVGNKTFADDSGNPSLTLRMAGFPDIDAMSYPDIDAMSYPDIGIVGNSWKHEEDSFEI